MAADHHMSERVYVALKRDVLAGIFASGRLQVSFLAERYDASATPVREALLRLVGEGLVVMPSTGGFTTRRYDVRFVEELYQLNLRLCLAAVLWRESIPAAPKAANSLPAPSVADTRSLFVQLAESTGSSAFVAVMAALNDRLFRVRQIEPLVLSGVLVELETLTKMLQSGDRGPLRRAILTYHRRRLRRIADIVGKLEAQAPGVLP